MKKSIPVFLFALTVLLLPACKGKTSSVISNTSDVPSQASSISSIPIIEVFTVNFDAGEGNNIASQQVNEGNKVTKPADPQKEGYDFVGWFFGEQEWSFDSPVTQGMTLVAHWVQSEYSVSFVDDEGTLLYKAENVHLGDAIAYGGEEPTKESDVDGYLYSFDGWDKELVCTGNMTVTAKFKLEKAAYFVRYYNDDDTLIYKITTNSEQEAFAYLSSGKASKDADDELQYCFKQWLKVLDLDGTYIYKATYDSCDAGLAFIEMGSNQYAVNRYTGTATNLIVPANWNGHVITEIRQGAFQGCTSLETVALPDRIQKIQHQAFKNCTNLISFTVPYQTYTIGQEAFYGCTNLKTISFPVRVTDISARAFAYCTSLTAIELPQNITSIGQGILTGCSSIETIKAPFIGATPSSNQFLGYFFGATSGGSNVSNSLKTVEVGNKCTSLADNAFANCASIQTITLPDTIRSMGYNCFRGCSSIRSFVVPDGVTELKNRTFENCYQLRSITLPDSLTTMGEALFNECSYLENLVIPQSVTSIAGNMIGRCMGLKYLEIPFIGTSMTTNSHIGLLFGSASYSNQADSMPARLNKVVITRASTLTIHAFDGVRVNHVVLPDHLTTIQQGCFAGCDMTSIIIPKSLRNVGESAFAGIHPTVYFCGSQEEWNVSYTILSNLGLTSNLHFYSEEEPTTEGKFWHYNDSGNPVAWPAYVAPEPTED